MNARRVALGLSAAWAFVAGATDADAQFADPCDAACAVVMSASSVAFATGTATALGRLGGGYATTGQGLRAWAGGFIVAAGAGIALSGSGDRQRRAVYGAGIGALGGAFGGWAIEALTAESSDVTRLAASLVGSAVGVAVGGALGALTHDGPERVPSTTFAIPGPRISVSLGF